MNLVSFEWTVCQQHKPNRWRRDGTRAGREEGVLVLSEFAGAADHLDDGALLVNPYDTQSLSHAMHEALSMPLSRRQALHKNACATCLPPLSITLRMPPTVQNATHRPLPLSFARRALPPAHPLYSSAGTSM